MSYYISPYYQESGVPKIFNTEAYRLIWHLDTTKQQLTSEDIFTASYIKKRGWTGRLMWLAPDRSLSYLREYNSSTAEQKIVTEWMEYYKTSIIENAILNWCNDFCRGKWDRFFKFGVEFEKEEDAILFKFHWFL